MTSGQTGRYSRQLLVWGDDGQARLGESSLLIAGVGGLGARVAELLTRAGVRELHLVDDGCVALSDLHRQCLYGEKDLGRHKVDVAGERLQEMNSGVRIISHNQRIDAPYTLPSRVRCVVDCLDTYSSRFALYDAVPDGGLFVHGGVQERHGQVLTLQKGRSQHLAGIFAGTRQPAGPIPVLPDSVTIIAGLVCSELFSILTASPRLLDRFLIVDLQSLSLSFLDV